MPQHLTVFCPGLPFGCETRMPGPVTCSGWFECNTGTVLNCPRRAWLADLPSMPHRPTPLARPQNS